jgi:predicted aspartyl protease
MLRENKIFFKLIFICMLSACTGQQEAKELKTFLLQKNYKAIAIKQNAAGHLLVPVIVNDVESLFILDTGAGATVVDSQQAEKLQVVLLIDSTEFTGAGAGGQGLEVIPSKNNRVAIGEHVLKDFPLSVMSLEHVRQAFVQLGIHEDFSGVIGVDILKPGKAIIDYSTMTLYLASVFDKLT